jgi:hypothetical protein
MFQVKCLIPSMRLILNAVNRVLRLMRKKFPQQFSNRTSLVVRILSRCSITYMLNVFRLLGSWNLQFGPGL